MPIYLPQLSPFDYHFPDIDTALRDPDGLLAMGGDLDPNRIITGYSQGIFPWFSEEEPLLWWSPSIRATINAGECHISKSMKKLIRQNNVTISINRAFESVIQLCAKPRENQPGTWITQKMQRAYIELHQQGDCHSIEVWQNKQLVGGLYGVCVGALFCGESMFSLKNNMSKLAFIALNVHFKEHGGKVIDCQMMTDHLKSLGVTAMPRATFKQQLAEHSNRLINGDCWQPQSLTPRSLLTERF
jgi:leucyl/phenylalanyl-tRNA--protein transferase